MTKIRKDVAKEMFAFKSRAVNSSLFLLTDNLTTVSCVPRKNRVVILLSSQDLDDSVTECEQNTSNMIFEYKKSKEVVDTADKLLKEYSCHRISRRWPFVLLT